MGEEWGHRWDRELVHKAGKFGGGDDWGPKCQALLIHQSSLVLHHL